jgi:primosomal protein N'
MAKKAAKPATKAEKPSRPPAKPAPKSVAKKVAKAEKPAPKKLAKPAAVKPVASKAKAQPEAQIGPVKEVAPKAKPAAKLELVKTPDATETAVTKASAEAPKAKGKGRKSQAAIAAEIKSGDLAKKWIELKGKHGSEKAAAYSMRSVYEPNTPLQHKTFGWGYVVNVENDRLDVLFETGSKILISNYKG